MASFEQYVTRSASLKSKGALCSQVTKCNSKQNPVSLGLGSKCIVNIKTFVLSNSSQVFYSTLSRTRQIIHYSTLLGTWLKKDKIVNNLMVICPRGFLVCVVLAGGISLLNH